MRFSVILPIVLTGISFAAVAVSDEVATTDKPDTATKTVDSKLDQLHADFAQLLNKSVLVGTFTIDGDANMKARSERYEIRRVVKQSQGEYWNFVARIQYGKHDVTVPIPIEVKWAGTTPVITVDNLTIPGMGTFDARVLISDKKYAGTWRHGKVGGLMYGKIEKLENEDANQKAEK